MTDNPLTRRNRHSVVQSGKNHLHIGLQLFDDVNNRMYDLSKSSSKKSVELARDLREHIRMFYKHGLHQKEYSKLEFIAGLPVYSVYAIDLINRRLSEIKNLSQAHVMKMFNFASLTLKGVEKMISLMKLALGKSKVLNVVEKVFKFISLSVSNIIDAGFGPRVSVVTKFLLQHSAKEKLMQLMQNPIESVTAGYDMDEAIFSNNESAIDMLMSCIPDISMMVDFVTSLWSGEDIEIPVTRTPTHQQKQSELPTRASVDVEAASYSF